MTNYAASPLVMAGFVELRAELQRQLAEQTEEKTDEHKSQQPPAGHQGLPPRPDSRL